MMASGVASGSTANASPGGAPAASTSRTAAKDAGRHQDDAGFAGVLADSSNPDRPARVAAAAAKESEAAAVAASHEQASGLTDEGVDKGADQDNLPEQILALLAGSGPSPSPATAPAPAPAMVAIGATSAGGPHSAAMLAADQAALTALTASPVPADTALRQLAAAGPAGALPVPLPGTVLFPGNTAPAGGAVPMADFAQALGLAVGKDGGESLPASPAAATGTDALEFALPGSQAAATSPSRAAAAAVAATPIPMPADPDAGFDDALGARIGWLADQRIGRAEIRVSPDHLGPIDVRLHIDGSRVSAEFTSANSDVRHALEASVGRLRDMLEQQGLQLAQSDVGSGQSNGSGGQVAGDGSDSHETEVVDIPTPTILRRGLLDEYA